MGSPLATSADGYFRYIAESVVNADFTEAKQNRQDTKYKCCILLVTRIIYTEILPGSISNRDISWVLLKQPIAETNKEFVF